MRLRFTISTCSTPLQRHTPVPHTPSRRSSPSSSLLRPTPHPPLSSRRANHLIINTKPSISSSSFSRSIQKSPSSSKKRPTFAKNMRTFARKSPCFYSLLRAKWPNSSIGDKKHCFTDLFSTADVFKPHHARLRVSACLIKTGLVFSRNNRPSASPSQPGTRQTPQASVSHAFSGKQPPSTAKTAPLPSFYRLKALYIREKSLFLHIFRVREAVRLCSPLTNRTL